MKTERLGIGKEDLVRAAALLRQGEVVALPTETVYGLGANALNVQAVRKIFAAKGRPQDNPLIVHISNLSQLPQLAREIPPLASTLARQFWPGPLTMVLKKSQAIPDEVSAGLDTVAIRFPAHPVAREIIELAAVPIAAPSANASGRPSTTTAKHVLEDLDGKVAAVVDGGSCGVGVESTVVDVTGDKLRLLRPGGITLEQLTAAAGPVEVDAALRRLLDQNETPRSPGMKYKHYAPRAPVTAVCGTSRQSYAYLCRHAQAGQGLLCFSEWEEALRQQFPGCVVISYGPGDDHAVQAQRLFDALRQFDETEVASILAQCPQEDGLGLAVANRLKKAAGFTLVQAGDKEGENG